MVRSFKLMVAWGLLLKFITRRELNKVLNYQLNPYARQREVYYILIGSFTTSGNTQFFKRVHKDLFVKLTATSEYGL